MFTPMDSDHGILDLGWGAVSDLSSKFELNLRIKLNYVKLSKLGCCLPKIDLSLTSS